MELQMKKVEMTLAQAKAHKVVLESKLNRADNYICYTNNFFTHTVEHLRKKYNPDAEDEVVVTPKDDEMICKPMEVVWYMEDLFFEIKKLSDEIEKSKKEAGLENAFMLTSGQMYDRVKDALGRMLNFEERGMSSQTHLNNMNRRNRPCPPLPPYLQNEYKNCAENMVTDYKLNVDGEQVTYQYRLERKYEPEFDKEEVREVLKKYREKEKQYYELQKQKEAEIQIAYTVKYPEGNSIEEDLKIFLAGA